MSRKPCGKRRNCSLQAKSPFPTMFSKAILLLSQNEYLQSKGLTKSSFKKKNKITIENIDWCDLFY